MKEEYPTELPADIKQEYPPADIKQEYPPADIKDFEDD